ncbi:hypothetical protein GCM10009745_47140 [Kribbella yunnanensis]|uniref:Uncharacterized protein n=1 Tax=Kribbella yunnanensis TaxID=190194 RepID=A0ABN2HZ11_9ACTN
MLIVVSSERVGPFRVDEIGRADCPESDSRAVMQNSDAKSFGQPVEIGDDEVRSSGQRA